MNMQEYNKVKDYTYLQYCDYLQEKYGIGLADYMTKSFNPNQKCKRTKEGLFAHHKMEDRMVMLSEKLIAMMFPFEWQQKHNIVYCDYLEHLLLHVLICKFPSEEKEEMANVGIGGVVNFLVPQLNDIYSGWETKQTWRQNCHNKIINDKAVYIEILKQFIEIEEYKGDSEFSRDMLCRSFNDAYGVWSSSYNTEIYNEIMNI